MELALNNRFTELSKNELEVVDGGFFGPTLFVIWGVKVTVGHCLAAGAAVGIAAGAAAN
ncbi:class IIb bacteriocin, lactobin A/cerein 7B family [Amphibacillus xylanus]|uniref:Bacteriocin n=1 Tax=Amphibacillus xylanus (strain ATCC 51415 / DSM 6626 / JCM 7361 / LMG 17667 / NBRC 15112 / Ep01) TaxID=698758 RepID=K0J6S5_AMPXN|nr:class IIb bacteriocin, lactobin A/cerein 7B family [Amphibacillus xylanus]BAM46848.1 hypothetical protein AXY_07160 [Amphibacillus xylanus NBRC 15112]